MLTTMKAHNRHYTYPFIWIIIAISGLHFTTQRSHAQHEFLDKNVIQKWKDYEAFSHSLQGTAHVQRTVNGKMEESTYRFKQNRGCALYIGPSNRDPLLSICSLANPYYATKINLSKTDPRNAILRDYTPLPGDMGAISPFEFVFMETSRHFSYSVQTLRQAVSDPSFKVTKVAKESKNGQKLIRVDHTYNHVSRAAKADIHEQRHGSIWLDPSRCWCLRRSKILIEATSGGERLSDTEADVVCETFDHPSGFPILKSVTQQVNIFIHKSKRKSGGTTKKDYELEVNDNVPDSEFTLSAFGLPEPGGAEPVKKPIPIYIWILIAASVCSALAFTFRYLARRKHLADAA